MTKITSLSKKGVEVYWLAPSLGSDIHVMSTWPMEGAVYHNEEQTSLKQTWPGSHAKWPVGQLSPDADTSVRDFFQHWVWGDVTFTVQYKVSWRHMKIWSMRMRDRKAMFIRCSPLQIMCSWFKKLFMSTPKSTRLQGFTNKVENMLVLIQLALKYKGKMPGSFSAY